MEIFIAAGIFTFGNALIFDRLFLGIIVFTAILCRRDVNVLSVTAIIFLQHLIEQLAWLYLPSTYLMKELFTLLDSEWLITFGIAGHQNTFILCCFGRHE